MANLDGITLVPEPSAERLNQGQRLDYEATRRECLSWLLVFGIHPKKGEGYAFETVKARAHRMDAFYRYVWDTTGGVFVAAPCWVRHGSELVSHDDGAGRHRGYR